MQNWLKQVNILSWGSKVSAAHEPSGSGGEKENASLCMPECKGSASVSVFYLAWCQPPSLLLYGVLGTHCSICVPPPACDLGHLGEGWGEPPYTRHACPEARVARQAALQAKLSPAVRSLCCPGFGAMVRHGSTVLSVWSEAMLKPDVEGHHSYKSNDWDLGVGIWVC